MKQLFFTFLIVAGFNSFGQASTQENPKRTYAKAEIDKLLEQNKIVVIDFFATWCGPCLRMEPTVEKLKKELKNKVVFVKIDADTNRELMQAYAIDEIPTYMIFKNKKLTMRAVGVQNETVFKEMILE